MVDDDLGLGDPAPTNDSSQRQQTPNIPQGGGVVDTEALVKGVADAVGPKLEGLTQRLQVVEETIQRATQKPETTPNPDVAPEDLQTRLLTDPERTIQDQFDKHARERLGPMLQTQLADRRDDLLMEFKGDTDRAFGDGTWAEMVEPDLQEALKNIPPEMQASRSHMSMFVKAIKGDKIDALMKRRAESEERQRVEQTNPPQMLSTGHPRPAEEEITQEIKEFCASYNRATGDGLTPKEWLELDRKGDTEDDWLPELQRENQ